MKRTFTFLMTALFLCMGVTNAAVTDLPQLSTEGATKWYTVKNVRTQKFATYAGDDATMTQQTMASAAAFFYFTASTTEGAVKIHNYAAGEKLCAAYNSWTATGIDWYLAAQATGVSICTSTGEWNAWNDASGAGQRVEYWSASDAGSAWEFVEVTDFSAVINISALKEAAVAEVELLASVSAIYPSAADAVTKINAVQATGTGLAELNTAAKAIEAVVADYRNAAYEALEGKYFTFSTPARPNGFMKLDGNRVVGIAEASSPAAVWQFVHADNAVKVFNPYTGKYLGEPGNSSADVPVAAKAEDAAAYQLVINDKAENAEAKVKFTSNGKSVHMAGGSVLVRWDNGGASEWTVAEVSEFSGIVSLYKAAALAAVDVYSALPEIFEVAAAKEAINAVSATDWSAFAAIDEAASQAIPTGTFAFQVTSGDNHRDSVWVSANMETSKAIGAVDLDENGHWTLKPANGGAFYIYNVKNGLYMSKPSAHCALTESPVDAYTVEVVDAEKNVVEFKCGGETLHASNYDDDKLINYDGDEAASRWTIVAIVEEPEVDPNDYTSAIANADLSTGEAWNTEGTKGISGGMVKVASESAFDFSQTITLPAGQYKMTAKAVYRYTGSEADEFAAIEAGTKTRLVNLYAETATYKYEAGVMNRYDGASDTDYAAGNGSVPVNGKFVPNSSAAVQAWFDNGQYVNELVFNVQEEGQIKIGLTRTGSISGDYTNIGAWTLTRLGDAEADPEVEEPTPDPEPEPEPEEIVDLDMTHLVGTSKEAWHAPGGPVNIDGITMPENFQESASTLGEVLWQQVEGLENGKYTVELWANARVAWRDSPATDGQEELTYLYANNVEISMKVLLNPGLNNNATYVLEDVEVTDGTMKIGMVKKAEGSNWHTIQIKSLTLHATKEVVVNIAKAELQVALDAANAVSPVTEALATAITAAQAVYDNSNDKDEVVAATAALKTAIILANNTNAVAGASEENPVLTNFVVNGTFDSSKDPWKSTTGAQNQALASNQQGAFTGNFFENWNGSNYTGKLYQVIENIPNGVYELSIAAFVETFDGSAQFVYANADKVALTTGAPTAYTVRTIVDNNTIEVGFEQTVAVNRWCGIDNVSLTYLGEASNEAVVNAAKEAFTAAYEEFGVALTACQAMMLKMSFYEIDDAAYQLNEQLETTTDVEALTAMTEALVEATASLNEINEVYAAYDVFVQKFKVAAEISEPTTAEAAELLEFNMSGGAGMQATSLEALAEAAESIKGEYLTYVANAKLLDGNKFDLTYLIQNPDFAMNLDGWTGVKANRIGGEGYDGVGGIAEIGEWGASSWDASMSQAITNLPNGKYVVKAAWMAASGIEMTFAANAGETTVTGIGDMGGNIAKDGSVVEMGQGHRGWQYVEVEGLVEDGTLTISVSSSSAAQHMWSNADAFELYYAGVPAPAEPEYLTVVGAKVGDVAIVEGVATVESISTIDVIFDRPVALAENAGWATLADSYGPTNLEAEVLEAEEGSSEYVVRFTVSQEFNGEFTAAGEYELNIPEGFIVGAEGANFINAEIAAVITIEAAPVTPLVVTNVTVGEDVMEGFSVVASTEDMIKVNFDGEFYFQGTPSIVDAEGNDASEHFEYMNGRDLDGSNSYILMGKTVGTYTITLAKASFMQMMSFKAPAEDIVLTVEITVPGGIQNIDVDADAVIYDIHGRRVTEMTKGLYIVNGKKVIVK